MYRRLFIWVEGESDKRFVEHVFKPLLEKRYDSVSIIKYAQKTREKRRQFIKSIRAMQADYFILADINHYQCITARKQSILDTYDFLDKDRIFIVVQEIESWYLAGLNDSACKVLGIKKIQKTDTLTKDHFNNIFSRSKYIFSKILFMSEILNHFSLKEGIRKNTSLNYIVSKLDITP